jgi:hypothetical protein
MKSAFRMMKTLAVTAGVYAGLSLAVLFGQAPGQDPLAGITNVPAKARDLLQLLVSRLDILDEDLADRVGRIDGITPPLMQLLKRMNFKDPPDYNCVFNLYYALKNRGDLSEPDLGWFRGRLNELWNLKTNSGFIKAFKDCALDLIGRYSSAENEVVLIHYLHEDLVDNFDEYSMSAMPGLARMGGERAAKELEEYAKTRDPRFDAYREAVSTIREIRERLLREKQEGNKKPKA